MATSRFEMNLSALTGLAFNFLLRLAYIAPPLLLFLTRLHHIPDEALLLTSGPVPLISGVWACCRHVLECLAALTITWDVISPFTTNWASAGAFTSLSALSPRTWFVRLSLTIIVSATFSCAEFRYMTAQWLTVGGLVYLLAPVVMLAVATMVSLLEKFQCSSRFLQQPDASTRMGSSSTHGAASRGNRKRNSRTPENLARCNSWLLRRWTHFLITSTIVLEAAASVTVMCFTIIQDIDQCSPWRVIFCEVLQLALAAMMVIYVCSSDQKHPLPYFMFFVALYLLSDAMGEIADLMFLPHSTYFLAIPVFAFGFFVCLSIVVTWAVVVTYSPNQSTLRKRLCQRLNTLFHVCRKRNHTWSFLQILSFLLANTGFVFAVVALGLPWFRLQYSMNKDMASIEDALNLSMTLLSHSVEEIENVVSYGKNQEKMAECKLFHSAFAAAISTSAVPIAGTALLKVKLVLLRHAKFYFTLAAKLEKYLRHVIALQKLANQTLYWIKTKETYTSAPSTVVQILLLAPILATGFTAVLLGLCPRTIKAGNSAQAKKRKTLLLGGALLCLACNILGMALTESWLCELTRITDGLPLVSVQVSRADSFHLVEAGYICSTAACFLFVIVVGCLLFAQNTDGCRSPASSARLRAADVEQRDIEMTEWCKRHTERQDGENGEHPQHLLRKQLIVAGEVPSHSWVPAIVWSLVSVILGIVALFFHWIDLRMNLGQKATILISETRSHIFIVNTIQEDLISDSKTCEIFSVNVSKKMQVFLSSSTKDVFRYWLANLTALEQLVNTSLLSRPRSALVAWRLLWIAPPVLSLTLTLIGFVCSFRTSTKFYFQLQEATTWMTKLALSAVVALLAYHVALIECVGEMQPGIIQTDPTFARNFALPLAAQLVIIIGSIHLDMEAVIRTRYHNDELGAPIPETMPQQTT